MARKHFTAEQIIGKLREAEILLSQGKTQEQAIRAIGVTGNTYSYLCLGRTNPHRGYFKGHDPFCQSSVHRQRDGQNCRQSA